MGTDAWAMALELLGVFTFVGLVAGAEPILCLCFAPTGLGEYPFPTNWRCVDSSILPGLPRSGVSVVAPDDVASPRVAPSRGGADKGRSTSFPEAVGNCASSGDV